MDQQLELFSDSLQCEEAICSVIRVGKRDESPSATFDAVSDRSANLSEIYPATVRAVLRPAGAR
jgi:hypothetical protein